MLLNDAFEHFRRRGVIPRPFRIDDGDRALLAHAQAIGLCAVDAVLAFRDSQLFEPALEVLPAIRWFLLVRRAFRLGLVGAEEDMTARLRIESFCATSASCLITDLPPSTLSCLVCDGLRGAGDGFRIAEIKALDRLEVVFEVIDQRNSSGDVQLRDLFVGDPVQLS